MTVLGFHDDESLAQLQQMGYRPAAASELPVRTRLLDLDTTKLFFYERSARDILHFAVFTPQSAPGTYSSNLLLYNSKALARAVELLPRVSHLLPQPLADAGSGALHHGFSWDVEGRADGTEVRRQKVDLKKLRSDVLDKLFWTSRTPARVLSLFSRNDEGPLRWFAPLAVPRTLHVAALAHECGMDAADVQRLLAPNAPVIEQALNKRSNGGAGTSIEQLLATLFQP